MSWLDELEETINPYTLQEIRVRKTRKKRRTK